MLTATAARRNHSAGFSTRRGSLLFLRLRSRSRAGVVNASAFQVWGQRETPQGEQASPKNLGILYMDNESNRRWVMRFDDPKQLAEIDAVFVTVEPRGRQPQTDEQAIFVCTSSERSESSVGPAGYSFPYLSDLPA